MTTTLFARLARRFEPQSVSDRRQFLKLAMAATAGLLVSDGAFGKPPRPSRGGRRIIVVGGGFAGLSCAHELMSAGCEVAVLESRRRVGGRVLSFCDWVKGKSVEGGGELIGTNHPTWLAYAKKFGLGFFMASEGESKDQPVFLGGKRLTAAEAKALFEEMNIANRQMNADAAAVIADEPWKTPRAVELDQMNTARWLRALPVSRLCKLAVASQLAGNDGVPLQRQSYLGNLAQVKGGGLEKYWTDSELLHCRGGNQSLAFRLAQTLGPRLRLETPVRAIEAKDDRVIVSCANGERLEGDDVVLAAPPSVWPRIQFTPGLPRALAPQMGVAVKYLSVVSGQFWRQEGLAPDSIGDGMVSSTWNGTVGQPGRDAVLVAFSGGPAAAICRRRWSQNRDQAYRDELETLYPGYARHFVASRFMDWLSDPWTQAAFSFPSPGQVTTVGPTLRAGSGRLHFAGEHTCYKFVGYMEGALDSGVSLAKRLCSAA